eukprot:TRINITY_DN9688_c0_g1_i1.p2 TRINITY_DN9688_c0_g1~~TRINITY_DN9688_c0_g1_i1.p2  ORF type:complete len:233 (+),score=72.85 TRINITY_DN9688_c0_g1_i1:69-767(+)
MPVKKRKLIIDTDGGGDDAIALLVALNAAYAERTTELVAITTCWGNVNLRQVGENIGKLLDFYDAPDIPLYRGAEGPLLGVKEVEEWNGHGTDGFGDADFPQSRRVIHTERHASVVICELLQNCKEDEEFQVVVLGPMTNLALAILLDNTITHRFQRDDDNPYPGLVVMGGAIEGKGNSSMIAEFNIHSDPEAAYVVWSHMRDYSLMLVSWELSLTCPMPWRELLLLFKGLS